MGEPNNPRARDLLAVENAVNTPDGRAFMWRFLLRTGIFNNTFDRDPMVHAHRAGLRESGLWMLNEIKEASFDSYLKMLKENQDE